MMLISCAMPARKNIHPELNGLEIPLHDTKHLRVLNWEGVVYTRPSKKSGKGCRSAFQHTEYQYLILIFNALELDRIGNGIGMERHLSAAEITQLEKICLEISRCEKARLLANPGFDRG
jgi:hypothetical protein